LTKAFEASLVGEINSREVFQHEHTKALEALLLREIDSKAIEEMLSLPLSMWN